MAFLELICALLMMKFDVLIVSLPCNGILTSGVEPLHLLARPKRNFSKFKKLIQFYQIGQREHCTMQACMKKKKMMMQRGSPIFFKKWFLSLMMLGKRRKHTALKNCRPCFGTWHKVMRFLNGGVVPYSNLCMLPSVLGQQIHVKEAWKEEMDKRASPNTKLVLHTTSFDDLNRASRSFSFGACSYEMLFEADPSKSLGH